MYEVGLLLLQSPLLPLSFSMVLVSPVTNLLDFLFLLVILCGNFYGSVFHSHNVGVKVLGSSWSNLQFQLEAYLICIEFLLNLVERFLILPMISFALVNYWVIQPLLSQVSS